MQDYNSSRIIDNINLLFINNNHFDILINHVSENIKKLEFKEFEKIITKANEGKTELIKTLNIKNIKNSSLLNIIERVA